MSDISCSIIFTLFEITFLGNWDVRREHPFLWLFANFPDATYFVHSVQHSLSCFVQFCWDLIRTCGFATCCLTDDTSYLRTKWWKLLLSIFLFSFSSFYAY